MGIKSSFNQFLYKNCPEIFETIHISEFCYQKIAIDISLYINKFKASQGENWKIPFIKMIEILRKNEVHCVFVFDGTPPFEKMTEKERRKKARNTLKEKNNRILADIDIYNTTGEITPFLTEQYNKITEFQKTYKRLLTSVENIPIFNIDIIIKYQAKIQSQLYDITPTDILEIKTLFDILDVPYIIAKNEAEALCVNLALKNLVSGVLTEDTDVMAYCCPNFISKFEISTGNCIKIQYQNILQGLKLTSDQFLDLCIMCGTDYNSNIARIGSHSAYKLIKQHGSIEAIEKIMNCDILNYQRVRKLFRIHEKFQIKYVPYCGIPDFEKLKTFLMERNILFEIDNLKGSFMRENIIIEEESDEEIGSLFD